MEYEYYHCFVMTLVLGPYGVA